MPCVLLAVAFELMPDRSEATAATPATAPAVDHLMIRSPRHRAPPAGITNSVVRAMLIMYVNCVSGLGHIDIIP